MTDPVQFIAVAVSAALLIVVLELVRRRRLTEEYSFLWIAGAAVLLGLSLWRGSLDVAARQLGVHYPPAVLLLVLTLFVFIICLSFSIVISRQREQIERLVEDIALLEADLRELREAVRTVSPGEVVAQPAEDGAGGTRGRRAG